MGRAPPHELYGVWGNLEVPPQSRRRGPVGETWFPRRERAEGERRSFAIVQVEHGQERLLRHLDAADLLHPLLALLLLLEQLPLPADVAAVALREHVLAPCLDRLAGDDPGADRRLDRHVEHLPRDLLPQSLDEQLPALVGEVAVDDQRERIDLLAADEDVDADDVAGP